jgi:nitrogen regulatory protein PII
MKLSKEIIEQIIKEELNEYGQPGRSGGVTIHPFVGEPEDHNHKAEQEKIYDDLADATLMEMLSVYNEDNIKEIVRFLADRASQGPGGVGGRFSDEQVEEVLMRVAENIKEKVGINLLSHMPQDREHPQYRDLE